MATKNNASKKNVNASKKPTNAARFAAEKLAAELAAAEAAKQAEVEAAHARVKEEIAAEAKRQADAVAAAAVLAATLTAPAANAAPVVTKVADDVFGNRLNSLRCRAINTAILGLAGETGEQSFTSRQITTMTHADSNAHNAKHVAEFGVPVKAISNHVLSLVVKRYLVCNAETGRYSLAPHVIEAVKAGKAK